MLDANGHLLQPDEDESPEEELARAREAEVWRLAGAFNRGEVNATRSGEEPAQTLTECFAAYVAPRADAVSRLFHQTRRPASWQWPPTGSS